MLVIRFLRTGKKAQPFFKIVVTDKKNPPRGGKFIESLGFVNPLTKEKNIKGERAKYWISVGAQPSDSVHNLLIEQKIIEGKKIPVHSKSKKKEEPKEEVKTETPSEPVKEEVSEETPKTEEVVVEEVKEEKKENSEEIKTETPEETPKEEIQEEKPETTPEEPKEEVVEEEK